MNESTPAPVPDEPSEKPKPDRPRRGRSRPQPRSSSIPLVLALVALGLSIGLAATAYFTWNQVQQLLSAQSGVEAQVDDRINPLRNSVEKLTQDIREERLRIDRQLKKLDEDQQSVGHRLSVLAALVGRSEQGWSLAEVEYLLRIANQRLQLQRDVTTAREALKAADQRLRDLADPHFLSVREQIARDLEAVEAVPNVDVDGISVSLSSWLESIDELKVAGTDYQPPVQTQTASLEPRTTAQDWRELPGVVWTSLSSLFQVREHDKPVAPMLPPEREYFLRENLRLQLSAARLALLRNDAVQYQTTLNTARDWLENYFSEDSAKVDDLAAQLAELAAVDIRPDLPDISGSLRVLRQQVKLSTEQAVLPVVPDRPAPDKTEPAPEEAAEQNKQEPAS